MPYELFLGKFWYAHGEMKIPKNAAVLYLLLLNEYGSKYDKDNIEMVASRSIDFFMEYVGVNAYELIECFSILKFRELITYEIKDNQITFEILE